MVDYILVIMGFILLVIGGVGVERTIGWRAQIFISTFVLGCFAVHAVAGKVLP